MGPHAGSEHEREPGLFFPRDTGVLVLSRDATSLNGAGGNDARPSTFLEGHACDTTSVHLAGGTAAISHELEDAIRRHSARPGQPGPVDAVELTPETETSLEAETHQVTAIAVDEGGRVTEAATTAESGSRCTPTTTAARSPPRTATRPWTPPC